MLDTKYIAGLFDGEGFISVNVWKPVKYGNYSDHYVRYQLFCGVGMTFRPIITELYEMFGGTFYHHHRVNIKRFPNCKPVYLWRQQSDNAANFLRQIIPHMIVKREEAELAIQLQEHIKAHKGFTRGNPELAGELYSFRQQLVDRMRIIKRTAYPVDDDPMLAA